MTAVENQNTDLGFQCHYLDLTAPPFRPATRRLRLASSVDMQPVPPARQCPPNSPVQNQPALTDAQDPGLVRAFFSSSPPPPVLQQTSATNTFLMTPRPNVETVFQSFSGDPTSILVRMLGRRVPRLARRFLWPYPTKHRESRPFFLIYATNPYVPGTPGCDGRQPSEPCFWEMAGSSSGGLPRAERVGDGTTIPNDPGPTAPGGNHGFEVGPTSGVGQMGTPARDATPRGDV